MTENETGAHAVEVAHVTEMIDEEDLARESVVDVRDLVIGDRKFLADSEGFSSSHFLDFPFLIIP